MPCGVSKGLAVLAWAMNLHELPAHDTLIQPPELYEAIGVPQAEKTQTILDAVKLRPIADLQDMRKHLTAAHWPIAGIFDNSQGNGLRRVFQRLLVGIVRRIAIPNH